MSDDSSVDDRVWFVYNSGIIQVPQHVRHVRIDPIIVQQIPDGAFAFCQRLEIVDLYEGLKEIESFAFRQCVSISVMTVPKSTTKVGDYAFDGCKQLLGTKPANESKAPAEGARSFDHKTQVLSLPANIFDDIDLDDSEFLSDCSSMLSSTL